MTCDRRDDSFFNNEAHSFSYLKMSFRTHTFRQLGRGFPIIHTQILGQRPLLIPVQRPTPTPLFLRIFQATSLAFQTRKVYVLLTALSSPPPLSLWRAKFTYEMFLRSKRVQPKKTNGKGGRKVISSSLTSWFRNQVRVDSLGQHLRINRTPIPEILLLGTDKRIIQPLPFMRTYLNNQGIQLDVMDTASPM